MLLAISHSLPYAFGVVFSAAPILAVVLLLVTSRPRQVGALFLLGWAAGTLAATGFIVAFVDLSVRPRLPPTAGAVIRIVLGAAAAVLAVRSWLGRERARQAPPKWIARIASWSSLRALVLGVVFATVNLSNLALFASGATAILEATTAPVGQAVAVVVFALAASLGVATPIVLRAVGGQAVNRALKRAGEWMTTYGTTISSLVLAIMAAILTIKGIAGLR